MLKHILSQSILATVAYADALNMPLTAMEVWRGLVGVQGTGYRGQGIENRAKNASSFSEIFFMLKLLKEQKKISEQRGFYFLPGKEDLVAERLWRMRVADEKWKKLMGIVRWLRAVPFLRAVFVTGSLALNNTRENSDYDIFLVSAPGRIFTVRFFVTLMLKMFGMYRSDACVADHVCPNHYVTERSLAIPFHSLYTAHIFATCVRTWSVDQDIKERFMHVNNWIHDYIQIAPEIPRANRHTLPDIWVAKIIRGIGEVTLGPPVGGVLEGMARFLQLVKIRANPKTKYPGSGHVVANDEMLAFHPSSPEFGVLDKYHTNMLQYKTSVD